MNDDFRPVQTRRLCYSSSLTSSHHKVMLRLEMLPTLDFDTSELDTLRLCFFFFSSQTQQLSWFLRDATSSGDFFLCQFPLSFCLYSHVLLAISCLLFNLIRSSTVCSTAAAVRLPAMYSSSSKAQRQGQRQRQLCCCSKCRLARL